MAFQNPHAAEVLRALSARIRAIPDALAQEQSSAGRNLDAIWGTRSVDWEAAQQAENERASRLLDQLIHKPPSGS